MTEKKTPTAAHRAHAKAEVDEMRAANAEAIANPDPARLPVYNLPADWEDRKRGRKGKLPQADIEHIYRGFGTPDVR